MSRTELPERLETERLVLRVRTIADAEGYPCLRQFARSLPTHQVFHLSRPWKMRFYSSRAYPSRTQSKENLPAGYGIVVKGTDKVIGSVDFNHRHADDVLEIGYTLHPDYWGRGYVPEAARALIDIAFRELGLR